MGYFTTKDNVQIYFEEYGSGDRYVLCTQVGHNKYSLEKELSKRGFHVFLLTNRGFGRSTHVTEDYGDHWYDRFAEDVVEFADHIGIDRFIYSGCSHGAGTGWHVVLNHPERVICFFAVVPGPHNLDEGKMSFRSMGLAGLQVKPPVFRVPSENPKVMARFAEQDAWSEEQKKQPDYEKIYESPETQAIDYGRPLRAYETEANVVKALETIKTPVLIVGGMEDSISRPDLMLRSAKALANCKLVIFSGFAHDLAVWEEIADDAVRFYENVMKTGYFYDEPVPESAVPVSEE